MNDDQYQYTEADVEATLKLLRLHYPKFATPENAVKVLVYIHDETKSIEDISDEEIEKLLENLEES